MCQALSDGDRAVPWETVMTIEGVPQHFAHLESVYLGIPLLIGFFLYFLAPLFIFMVVTISLIGIAIPLAFFKLGGRSLLSIFLGFLQFSVSPKSYRWQKTRQIVATPQTQYAQQSQKKATPIVPLVKESKVGSLSTQVVTNK